MTMRYQLFLQLQAMCDVACLLSVLLQSQKLRGSCLGCGEASRSVGKLQLWLRACGDVLYNHIRVGT